MDTTKDRIKAMILLIDSSLSTYPLLDFSILEILDRVLILTNRAFLMKRLDKEILDGVAVDDRTTAIPPNLERALARMTIQIIENDLYLDDVTQEVASMSDNGQSVTFKTAAKKTFSESDKAFLTEFTALLKSCTLGKVIKHDNSATFSNGYW